MFEVAGALLVITLQQPLLALVSLAITPLLSRVLRAVVVRSSAIIYRRQQVRGVGGVGGVGGGVMVRGEGPRSSGCGDQGGEAEADCRLRVCIW